MRIVALGAGCGRERLSVVRLDELFILGVVAIQTEGRRSFRQVVVKFLLSGLADFMGGMAGIASHVERGMPAAALRRVGSLGMASEAEILFAVAGRWFQ